MSFNRHFLVLAHGRIHIEQRPPVEATQIRGKNVETGEIAVVRITPEGVGSGGKPWQGVYNPSFDVTPAELISEFIRARAESSS